ncbi:MAG: winged helix-turn-helix transcriptional regulator [Chloroflexi bacterium]|nr:winged helix-turn-helix transcriptional regulator [Chloroflexota bacterium]
MLAPALDGLSEFLKALGDQNRLAIFAVLTRGELCVCELEATLGLSQSLVSNHLRVLKRLGLVRARRDAVDRRWVYYSLDEAAVARLRERCLAVFDLSQMDRAPACCGPQARRC